MSEFKRVLKSIFFTQSIMFEISFGSSLMLGALLFLWIQPPSPILTTVLSIIGYSFDTHGEYRRWKIKKLEMAK